MSGDSVTRDAKRYLQRNSIPQLFEGIMTGLIHHQPADPIGYMAQALQKVKNTPGHRVQWDSFLKDSPTNGVARKSRSTSNRRAKKGRASDPDMEGGSNPSMTTSNNETTTTVGRRRAGSLRQRKPVAEGAAVTKSPAPPTKVPVVAASSNAAPQGTKRQNADVDIASAPNAIGSGDSGKKAAARPRVRNKSTPPKHAAPKAEERPSSLEQQAKESTAPAVPVILFMGGPGVHKTKHATRAAQEFTEHNLVHICAPELIRRGINDYKETKPEWKEAERKYEAGELIDASLVLALVKEDMMKHPSAKAFLLEGYPRELKQVTDFEKEVKNINLALILDYDEETLAKQMKTRGLKDSVIQQRLHEYKVKTLPAAKYFDDKMLLHLIPGEQEQEKIIGQMRLLLSQAMGLTPAPSTYNEAEKAVNADDNKENKEKSSAGSKKAKISPLNLEDIPKGLPNDAPVILVVAAPGVNKAEYCKRIVKKYDGFVHLSMGSLLRKEIKKRAEGEEMWMDLEKRMKAGETLPIAPCRKLMHDAISKTSKSWGYVIEGYPRTVEQAKDFEKLIDRIDVVLLIDCTEQWVSKQLTSRSEKAKRLDDNEEAGKARLNNFKAMTLRMLKYFEDKNKLKVVDGDKAVSIVFPDVSNAIDAALFIPENGTNGDGQSLQSSKSVSQKDVQIT